MAQIAAKNIPLPAGFGSWWNVPNVTIATTLGFQTRNELYAVAKEILLRSLEDEQADPKSRKFARESNQIAESLQANSRAFLSSYEWRRVRMEALKKYGAKCQCCGATPTTGAVMNVDHIKPRKIYPELALCLDNLQILCGACNHGKGNWDMTDWRKAETE